MRSPILGRVEDSLALVPLVALLCGGLAGVALVPRSVAARALACAGALLVAGWLVEQVAREYAATAGVVVRLVGDALFLGGLAAVVAVLVTYPDGRWERSWHRRLVFVLIAATLAGAVARLVGSDTVSVGLAPETAIANPLAVEGLGWLGTLGYAVVWSEPAWLLIGLAVLALRRRRAAEPRPLDRLLASLALLALLLVMVVVGGLTDAVVDDTLFAVLFLFALTLLPLELLRGITVRARSLERDLQASRQRIVGAEDQARRRIERDLHDGVQQQLVALLSLVELASHQAPADATALRATLDDLRSLVGTTVADLREVVLGIRPPALEDSGIAAALESRFERLPPHVTTDLASLGGRRFAAEVEATAYFVACEGVTNALKHAPGSPVHVSLAAGDGTVRVSVIDDGPGPRAGSAAGTGLAGLRDRVDSLGGRLEWGRAPGRGSRLLVELPVGGPR